MQIHYNYGEWLNNYGEWLKSGSSSTEPYFGAVGMSEEGTTRSTELNLANGDQLHLKVEPNGRHIFWRNNGRGAAHYHQEQVEALGEGNVAIGVVNILSRILSDSEKFFAPANVIVGSAEEIQDQNTIPYPTQPLQLDR